MKIIHATGKKTNLKKINQSFLIIIFFLHPSLKYLKNKPVRDLKGDEYLKLTIAQSDNLLNVEINEHIDGLLSPNFIDEVKQLYQKVGFQF